PPLARAKRRPLKAAGVERVARTAGARDGLPLLEDGRALAVANVVWATGYRPDFPSIDLTCLQPPRPPPPRPRGGRPPARPVLRGAVLPVLGRLVAGRRGRPRRRPDRRPDRRPRPCGGRSPGGPLRGRRAPALGGVVARDRTAAAGVDGRRGRAECPGPGGSCALPDPARP